MVRRERSASRLLPSCRGASNNCRGPPGWPLHLATGGGYLANVPPSTWAERYERAVPEALSGAAFLQRYGLHWDSVTSVDPEQVGAACRAALGLLARQPRRHRLQPAAARLAPLQPQAEPHPTAGCLPLQTYAVRVPAGHPVAEHFRVEAFRQVRWGRWGGMGEGGAAARRGSGLGTWHQAVARELITLAPPLRRCWARPPAASSWGCWGSSCASRTPATAAAAWARVRALAGEGADPPGAPQPCSSILAAALRPCEV